MVFSCSTTSKDLDPLTHILYLRAAGIRRTVAKNPLKKGTVFLIMKRYLAGHKVHDFKKATKASPFNNWQAELYHNDDYDQEGSASEEEGPTPPLSMMRITIPLISPLRPVKDPLACLSRT